jgi:hypothetical protein
MTGRHREAGGHSGFSGVGGRIGAAKNRCKAASPIWMRRPFFFGTIMVTFQHRLILASYPDWPKTSRVFAVS